jgi:hypothetical protein
MYRRTDLISAMLAPIVVVVVGDNGHTSFSEKADQNHGPSAGFLAITDCDMCQDLR